MKIANDYPDVVIGCCGGGSNMAGIGFPFLRDKIAGSRNPRVIAVEPASGPTLTKGVYAYDFGDTARLLSISPRTTSSWRAGSSTTSTRRPRYGKRFPACRRWERKEGDVPDQGVRGDLPRGRRSGRRGRRGRGGDPFLPGIDPVRATDVGGADREGGREEGNRRRRVRQRDPGEDHGGLWGAGGRGLGGERA